MAAMSSLVKTLPQPSFDTSMFARSSRIVPDRIVRTNNYRRVLLNRKGKIDCKVLYRTIMRLEKPFRRSKTLRHRFIRNLFLAACDPEIDYNSIVKWLKEKHHVCVTVAEVRQLVLYCGIFGETDKISPMRHTVRYVLKNCVLSVPRLHMFKKWCKDVKRLESCPDLKGRSKGYFAGDREDETCTIMSLIEDFQSYDDMDSEKGLNIDNDDDSVDSIVEESPKLADKFKKSIRSVLTLNKMGFLSAAMKKKEKAYAHRRKRGNANVYFSGNSRNKPEFNKFIANLNKEEGPSKDTDAKPSKDAAEAGENHVNNKSDSRNYSLFVKSFAPSATEPSVETVPEVDVDIMLDVMKESFEQQEECSRQRRGSKLLTTPRQSMAKLMFNQKQKSKKSLLLEEEAKKANSTSATPGSCVAQN